MDSFRPQIIHHLDHAIRRDIERGGSGMRSTREILDRLQSGPWPNVLPSMAQLRKLLWAMADEGLIEAFNGGGEGLCWRLVPKITAAMKEMFRLALVPENRGCPWRGIGIRARAGGAKRRMFELMKLYGWFDDGNVITKAGRQAAADAGVSL